MVQMSSKTTTEHEAATATQSLHSHGKVQAQRASSAAARETQPNARSKASQLSQQAAVTELIRKVSQISPHVCTEEANTPTH